jgi:hypothetical protein
MQQSTGNQKALPNHVLEIIYTHMYKRLTSKTTSSTHKTMRHGIAIIHCQHGHQYTGVNKSKKIIVKGTAMSENTNMIRQSPNHKICQANHKQGNKLSLAPSKQKSLTQSWSPIPNNGPNT